jgi:tetratricopeptide (TPR) repeat protein
VSNLFVIIGTPLAERQLYLPSVGACLLAALCFESAARRWGPRIPAAVLFVVAVLALARTTTWTRAWASDEALFTAALESVPRSVRVLGNLAVERADEGRLEEARGLLERAVAIAPEFVPNLVNLAGVELDLRDISGAQRTAERAVAADPRSAAAQAQLGLTQAAGGNLEAAEGSLREAIRLDPEFADARKRLDDVVRRRAASGSDGL